MNPAAHGIRMQCELLTSAARWQRGSEGARHRFTRIDGSRRFSKTTEPRVVSHVLSSLSFSHTRSHHSPDFSDPRRWALRWDLVDVWRTGCALCSATTLFFLLQVTHWETVLLSQKRWMKTLCAQERRGQECLRFDLSPTQAQLFSRFLQKSWEKISEGP